MADRQFNSDQEQFNNYQPHSDGVMASESVEAESTINFEAAATRLSPEEELKGVIDRGGIPFRLDQNVDLEQLELFRKMALLTQNSVLVPAGSADAEDAYDDCNDDPLTPELVKQTAVHAQEGDDSDQRKALDEHLQKLLKYGQPFVLDTNVDLDQLERFREMAQKASPPDEK